MSFKHELKNQLFGLVFFNYWIFFLVVSSPTLSYSNSYVYASHSVAGVCRADVYREISRKKEALAVVKVTRIVTVSAAGSIVTLAIGVFTGGVAAPISIAATGITIMAILDTYDRNIRKLNEEEDMLIDQCDPATIV